MLDINMTSFVSDKSELRSVKIIARDGKTYATAEFLKARIPEYMSSKGKSGNGFAPINLPTFNLGNIQTVINGKAFDSNQLSIAGLLMATVKWYGTVGDACDEIDTFTAVMGFDKLVKQVGRELELYGPKHIGSYGSLVEDAGARVGSHTMELPHAKIVIAVLSGDVRFAAGAVVDKSISLKDYDLALQGLSRVIRY